VTPLDDALAIITVSYYGTRGAGDEAMIAALDERIAEIVAEGRAAETIDLLADLAVGLLKACLEHRPPAGITPEDLLRALAARLAVDPGEGPP
jgi:hypothetical protein